MHPDRYLPYLPPPPEFAAAVFATSYLNPLQDRFEVEQILHARGVVGVVLLDMLLAHASATRRYFALDFDGLEFKGMSRCVETSSALEAYSKKAYKRCPFPVDKSLLSPPLRAMF